MSENYKCPVCERTFPYTMFAGRGVVKCDDCKEQIKDMTESTGGGYY
jgi:ribosomal protein L37AE/L43A